MDKSRIGFLSKDFHEKRQYPILLFYDTKVEMRVSPKDYHSEKVEIDFLFLNSNLGLVTALVFCMIKQLSNVWTTKALNYSSRSFSTRQGATTDGTSRQHRLAGKTKKATERELSPQHQSCMCIDHYRLAIMCHTSLPWGAGLISLRSDLSLHFSRKV